MTPDPKVIEAANFQPEYVKPIGEYIDRVVSDKRIATGKQMLEENKALLDVLEKRYGVDRTIIIAIWGVESNYGTQPGDMNVIRSLATLAYYRHQGEVRPAAAHHRAQDPAARRYPARADERLLGRRHGPHPIHPHDLSELSPSTMTATASATSGTTCPTRWPRPRAISSTRIGTRARPGAMR